MKYQDKIRASWETTESGRLALGIHDIENADVRKKNEWLRDGVMHWHLTDDVRLEISTDKLMWYLFKTLPDQARYFFKAVPRFCYGVETINNILEAQAWTCL